MAGTEDRDRPGGWMVRASALGGLVQTFFVYELDDKKATLKHALFGECVLERGRIKELWPRVPRE